MSALTLALSGRMHTQLKHHLFPGDGCEAAAILLCRWAPGPRRRLLVQDILPVPHEACWPREPDAISWPGEYLEQAIDQAEPEGLVLILLHSHPGGFLGFSALDDRSDQEVIPCLFAAFGQAHGTAVMTPSGAMTARLYTPAMEPEPVELVSIAGDQLSFDWADQAAATRPMAFTQAMTQELGRLSATVIGASGTGSLVAEQLARLGFGRLILIDFDRVETRNLNRIVNATRQDAASGRLKVEVLAEAIAQYRDPATAVPVAASMTSRDGVLAAAQGDVLFCCVDSLDARQIADLMAQAFLLPLFDVGVTIPLRRLASGPAILDVCGRIDYVQPGGATLRDRGIYSPDDLQAEYLRRLAPETYLEAGAAGYFQGGHEEAPAVITLNMRAASACVNEFIARAYPFRLDSNALYAQTQFSLAACEERYASEADLWSEPHRHPLFAQGDLEPLLGLPVLQQSGS